MDSILKIVGIARYGGDLDGDEIYFTGRKLFAIEIAFFIAGFFGIGGGLLVEGFAPPPYIAICS